MNNLDDSIKKAFKNNIEINNKDKEEVWNNINKRLYYRKKKNYKPLIGIVATIFIILMGLQTEIGYGIINQIKETFTPKKEITEEIEGNKEKTEVQLKQSKKSNYIIYIDEERYKFIEGKDSDKIVMKEEFNDDLPEISMEIKQLISKSPEDLINKLEAEIKAEYEIFYEVEKITTPIKGWRLKGLKGQEWNSEVIKIYIISNGNNGSFLIIQRYFLEAEEGHGVRFDEMLKTFQIIKE